MNGARVWVETGLPALSLCNESPIPGKEMERKLALDEQCFKNALEILSMSAQYFRDITEHGVDEAYKTVFFVHDHDAVNLESYYTARKALTSKTEVKSEKILPSIGLKKKQVEEERQLKMWEDNDYN